VGTAGAAAAVQGMAQPTAGTEKTAEAEYGLLYTLTGHEYGVSSVRFAPKGNLLASACA
jgi:hypothetical protein